jgi:hypothetical protein
MNGFEDLQRLHHTHCGRSFFRLIADLHGPASRDSFLQGGHHRHEFFHRTATIGVQHMGQDHWARLTHIRHKALPDLPGDTHVSHRPVQGSQRDPEFVGDGSQAVVAKAIACLGQSQGVSHRQEGKRVAGQLPFMPQKSHVKTGIVCHQHSILEQGVDLWQERGKGRGPGQHRVGNAMHRQGARVHRPLRIHQGVKTGEFVITLDP